MRLSVVPTFPILKFTDRSVSAFAELVPPLPLDCFAAVFSDAVADGAAPAVCAAAHTAALCLCALRKTSQECNNGLIWIQRERMKISIICPGRSVCTTTRTGECMTLEELR